MTHDELRLLQALPLEIKVAKSQQRIHDAVARFGTDGLYISLSGGKDSLCLFHLVRDLYPDIPAVFCNTGLEYPEVREKAEALADTVIRPTMSFLEVLKNHGYPVISKEISLTIEYARKGSDWAIKRLNGDHNYGNHAKYKYLLDTDYKISDKCCLRMKKEPFRRYEKETGRIPIIGMMASEGGQRETSYKRTGCNAFDTTHPKSLPLGFWKEQDILEYIQLHNIEIPDVYGEIIDVENKKGDTVLELTGVKRTGCLFCAYGANLESTENNRFLKLKNSHPKLYDYCMRGGKHDEDGVWVPDKGLGMDHVLSALDIDH